MPGKRSARIQAIKDELAQRLREGHRRAGNWFVSNREVAKRYGICYQTAHRIMAELRNEGLIHRTPSSGTYVASEEEPPQGVALILHPRCVETGIFGGIVKEKLIEQLEKRKIDCEVILEERFEAFPPGRYCMIWANHYDLRELSSSVHYTLLFDSEALPGLNATFTDSVMIDWHAAGVTGGEYFRSQKNIHNPALFTGPQDNLGNERLIAGFREIYPDAPVYAVDSWNAEPYEDAAQNLDPQAFDALYTVNDRATQYAAKRFGDTLPILGYCNQDYAMRYRVPALLYPWDEIINEAIRVYLKRNQGDNSVGAKYLIKATPYNLSL